MRFYTFLSLLGVLASLVSHPSSARSGETENVILVTIDGLRGQEVFGGADQRLINKEAGGVRSPADVRTRYWRPKQTNRRKLLMPFLWKHVVPKGQILGDISSRSIVKCTNGKLFSYPGYNELLSGFGDDRIDSNDKVYNPNKTVLEWLHEMPGFRGRVAVFGSWDVFPFIVNDKRNAIYVNAGWTPLDSYSQASTVSHLNRLAAELPKYWDNVRYDVFTFQGAKMYLSAKRPRVLYVALGETDDWAHSGRYDLYLDAANRNDRYIKQLWETAQSLPSHKDKTTLIITTDHGRGDGRESWKSHSSAIPGCEFIWIASLGPDTAARGVRGDVTVTQSQIAATVAAFLGKDFAAANPKVSPPIVELLNGSLGESKR